MKKLLSITAIALCAYAASANAAVFSSAIHSYSGAEVNAPVNMAGSSDYNVNGDLIVNNSFTSSGSGDVRVDGNMIVNAPTSLYGSGDIEVNGDLVVQSDLRMTGSGDIVVGGKIIVINGHGSLTSTGSGDVRGDIVYADAYEGVPTPVAKKKVYRHTAARSTTGTRVRTTTGTTVDTTAGANVVITPGGIFTDTTSITPGGIVVHQ